MTPHRKFEMIKGPDGAEPEHLPQPFFRTEEPVPESGIYRVFHGDHRVTHEVTLLKGERFPQCRQCGPVVHFELLRAAPDVNIDSDFRIHLYQVPHPKDEREQAEEAVAV